MGKSKFISLLKDLMRHTGKSPLVNVILFSIFWALEVFVAKLAFLKGAQLVPFSLQSTFLTLIFISLYTLFIKRKEFKKISFATVKWVLLANAIHFGVGGFLSNAGVQLTTAINAGFLLQFTVVTGTILAWLVLKEKMTKEKIISIITIMLGTFLLITKGQLIIPHLGDILLLFACLAWSIGGIMIKVLLKRTSIDPDIISFFRPIAGIPVMLAFILFSQFYPLPVQRVFQMNIFELHQIVYVLLNAIFISFTWIFVNRTLKLASASYTAMLPAITPILLSLLAMVFLHEQIEGVQFIGIILIIASSFVVQYFRFDKH